MKELLVGTFVALLMVGCGGDDKKQTAAKIRIAKESGSTELELYAHQITDLTPLAKLADLRILGLGYNDITDVTPLAGLTNLKTLWLPNNRIADVTPLAKLTKLRTLYLAGNPISDEQKVMLRKALPNCNIEF